MSFIRLFQATYDDRFGQGLICPPSGKFRIYTASSQFSKQIEIMEVNDYPRYNGRYSEVKGSTRCFALSQGTHQVS